MSISKLYSILLVIITSNGFNATAQKFYSTSTGHVSFFAKAPVSNISAQCDALVATYENESREIKARIRISDFMFPRALMRQHFNDRYMHSEKFPEAYFQGVLNTKLKRDSVATYNAVAEGLITIHGISKAQKFPVMLHVNKQGTIIAASDFIVHLEDYNIETPTLFYHTIADSIAVALRLTLVPTKF